MVANVSDEVIKDFFYETFLVKIQRHYQCIHLRNWSVFYFVKFIIYKQIEKSWKCIGKKGWESWLSSGVICWLKIKTILALSGPRSKPVRWCSLESCQQINDYNVRWFWKNFHISVTQTYKEPSVKKSWKENRHWYWNMPS